MMDPYLQELKNSFDRTTELIEGIDDATWVANMPGGWTMASEAIHMLASIKPISLALPLPRVLFRALGKPNRAPKNYDQLVAHYKLKASKIKSPPRAYDPNKKGIPQRQKWLKSWKRHSARILDIWSKWGEEDFKKYLAPHPLLGKIHFEELVYFTIYHNELHRRNLELKKRWREYDVTPVTMATDIRMVSELATEIWNEHYPSIIGQQQVDYMVEKFQSAGYIQKQMEEEGLRYFILKQGDRALGYLAVQSGSEGLFVSKVYLHKDTRGQGLGKMLHYFIRDLGRAEGHVQMWLTVNKENHMAIKAYEDWGYERKEALIMDIGNGFVMDDFKYVYAL